jgi:hypothetical protein
MSFPQMYAISLLFPVVTLPQPAIRMLHSSFFQLFYCSCCANSNCSGRTKCNWTAISHLCSAIEASIANVPAGQRRDNSVIGSCYHDNQGSHSSAKRFHVAHGNLFCSKWDVLGRKVQVEVQEDPSKPDELCIRMCAVTKYHLMLYMVQGNSIGLVERRRCLSTR